MDMGKEIRVIEVEVEAGETRPVAPIAVPAEVDFEELLDEASRLNQDR